ncbi:Poly (ADP-ribose) glycohydrolase (PARG) [Seminavis robusta]|uniref:Poly (ADP-ribose) glycohydrolase (PARG) n=1 Tax=Seminavis robusta TaxID=568900 RepID=A0A9N8E7D6_9STRA|nr:Poly (ADP-ribose) glycohydrolase (PARG) [Seminavis robusta]|eukprot:Sro591_g172060.1 Poly (ADP-ribose) glycohydrolase (PARG) (871) ;mRNA; f:39064-41676
MLVCYWSPKIVEFWEHYREQRQDRLMLLTAGTETEDKEDLAEESAFNPMKSPEAAPLSPTPSDTCPDPRFTGGFIFESLEPRQQAQKPGGNPASPSELPIGPQSDPLDSDIDLSNLSLVPVGPPRPSDSRIMAEFLAAAVLMVLVWFSVCYRQLQHSSRKQETEPISQEAQREKRPETAALPEPELEQMERRPTTCRVKSMMTGVDVVVQQDDESQPGAIVEVELSRQLCRSNSHKSTVSVRSARSTRSVRTTPSEDKVLESCNHVFEDEEHNHAIYQLTTTAPVEQRNPQDEDTASSSTGRRTEREGNQPNKTKMCHRCKTTLDASWRFCCSCGATVSILASTPIQLHTSSFRTAVEDDDLEIVRSRSEECTASTTEHVLKRTNSTGSMSYLTARSVQSRAKEAEENSHTNAREAIEPQDETVQADHPKKPTTTSLEKLARNKASGQQEDEELIHKDDYPAPFCLSDDVTSNISLFDQIPQYPSAVTITDPVAVAAILGGGAVAVQESSMMDPLNIKFRRTDSVCIGSRLWPLAHLQTRYPPKWGHPNKEVIAQVSWSSSATPKPEVVTTSSSLEEWIRASRWSRPSALPKRVKRAKVYVESSNFSYDTSGTKRDHRTTHWHLNFAGDRLFRAGEGTTFEEEELQVLEHPCLASLAIAIQDARVHRVEGLSTLTHEPEVGPTPILIKGAQRTCHINTRRLDPEFLDGAAPEEVREATEALQIPVTINIAALPAIPRGEGRYTVSQIRRLFIYAYTGFRAVVLESGGRKPVLHTGFWGCDDLQGGNKGLTSAIQILAAGTAGIKYIHFKPGDNSAFDRSAMWHGINVANALHGQTFDSVVKLLVSSGYSWSDQDRSHLPYQPPPASIWTN